MVHMQITPSEDPIISATVDSISNVAHGPQHGILHPDLTAYFPLVLLQLEPDVFALFVNKIDTNLKIFVKIDAIKS